MRPGISARRARPIGIVPRIAVGIVAPLLFTAVSHLPAEPGDDGRVSLVPEYDRTMELVLISVPVGVSSDGVTDGPTVPTEYLFWTLGELMSSLPDYSEVIILVSPPDRQRVSAILERVAPERVINLQVVRPPDPGLEIDIWAQDLGEPFSRDGASRFMVSMEVEGVGPQNRAASQSRQVQSRQLFGETVQIADFVFEGGNLVYDRIDGRLRVLVGFNDISLTYETYATRGNEIPDAAIYQKISEAFGGAEVVEMGLEIQSPFLRHLDQSFLLLHGQIAIINTIPSSETGAELEKKQLDQHRKELEALDYTVLSLANTASEMHSFYNSLNAVPYVDKSDDSRKILFPVFPGEVERGFDGRLDASRLRGKARKAYELFESVGYSPIPLRDFTFVAGGNTHCVTNVLR